MKKIKSIIILIHLLTLNFASFSQNISVSNITHNSAKISFPNTEGQSIHLHVFTKSVDDTIVFFEDFSGFPKVDIGNYFCGSQVSLNLPSTYTLISGCQAKNLYSTYKDTCYFYSNGEFITPFLDLSKSNGNYRIKCKIRNLSTSTSNYLRIYQSDSLGNYSNYSTIMITKNSTKQYDSIFSGGTFNNRIKLLSTSYNLAIDDLSISYIFITKTPLNSSPINSTSTYINLNSLNPNTTYYCYLEGRTDTISFKTIDKIISNSISNINPNSARINFSSTDNISDRKLIIRQKSNNQNIFAEDLFISEYTCTDGNNKAIEIYNGTEKDICLQDYSVKYSINASYDSIFYFSQFDTIKSNKCIVIMENLNNLAISNNGIFYKNYKLKGYATINGDDAIAIIKDGNYVDIFGCLGEDPGIGWVYGTGTTQRQTNSATLRRNSNVNKGIKINPTSGFPSLGTEWTQIGADGSVVSSNFEDFGRHTMDNAYGNFDSLVLSINIGLNDTSYILNDLEEETIYEAYLVIGSGNDTVVSNSLTFKTGVNTQRIANGDWNDDNWSKGIPSNIDNAIISNGQTLTIPNGINAYCYNLIIKDTLNQTKASLINYGTLDVENKTMIEAYLRGYTTNNNGWNLLGLPINVSTSSQDTIGHLYFHPATNDDLYYWEEDYTDIENNGRWINWKDIPENSGDFFVNTRGYLLSYQQNTHLKFYGDLNNSESYSVLSNASLSSPNNLRGWHLCSNPYPFYIKINQLQRLNVSLPSLLEPHTSNYNALIQSDSIPPFAGFMVQVIDANNDLNINKSSNITKVQINPNILTINVYSSQGSDKTRLIIMDSVSLGYDVEYDNRKLNGYSLSPEIYSKSNNENFAVNAIPIIEDSLIMDINFISKSDDNYTITLDVNEEEYDKIALFDKANNIELIDFKIDSSYTFYCTSENNPDKFQLKIFKALNYINNIKIDESIRLKQIEDEVIIISDSKIKTLELTNMKGQLINKNYKTNSIKVTQKGVFLFTITTINNTYKKKIIYL